MADNKDVEMAVKTDVEDIGVHKAVGDDQSKPSEKHSLKNVGALEVFSQNTHAPFFFSFIFLSFLFNLGRV